MELIFTKPRFISTEEFDHRFDEGEDITEFLDLKDAERPDEKPQRISVDFPVWMINKLDREARRLGITRQSVIKYWISEKLQEAQ